MRIRLSDVLVTCGLSLLVSLPLTAQMPPMGQEPASRIAVTGLFEFHSSFWLNLHDRLYELGQPDAPVPGVCSGAGREGQAWQDAVAFYRERMAGRHHRTDDLMWALRTRLAFGADHSAEGIDDVVAVLKRAAPVFAICEWPGRQAANLAWVEQLNGRLKVYETVLRDRLVGFFQSPWPAERIRVDVVSYASWSGANTIVGPDHIMMSSVNDGYREWAAMEMVFHEASHLLVDDRNTHVGRLIREASSRRSAEPPFNLWHAVLFYTVGWTTQQELAAGGHEGYEPYVYKRGLFRRTWRDYQEAIETHWQSYLDGSISLESAVDGVVEAVIARATRPGN